MKTYELVSFSNQIATGMVFLASRGVCHENKVNASNYTPDLRKYTPRVCTVMFEMRCIQIWKKKHLEMETAFL